MGRLVSRAVADIRPEIESRGRSIRASGEWVEVEGDEVLLRQALSNLLRNALEACTGPAPAIEVDGGVDAEGGLMTLQVLDNGPGIPPANRERVFRPFFTTKSAGTGLGLALVQNRRDPRRERAGHRRTGRRCLLSGGAAGAAARALRLQLTNRSRPVRLIDRAAVVARTMPASGAGQRSAGAGGCDGSAGRSCALASQPSITAARPSPAYRKASRTTTVRAHRGSAAAAPRTPRWRPGSGASPWAASSRTRR